MKTLAIKYWNLFSAIVLLLGAAWIWLSAAPPGSTSNGAIPAPRQGFLAPDFELQSASGETIRLSDLRGRPVLVNIWASWCPPCRAEMPAMQTVYEAYRQEGFLILAVNATNQDSRQEALAFAQEYGLTFPILFDETGSVTQAYLATALPTSLFIDPDGVIQEVVIGGPMSEALLRTRVQKLFEAQP